VPDAAGAVLGVVGAAAEAVVGAEAAAVLTATVDAGFVLELSPPQATPASSTGTMTEAMNGRGM